MIHRNGDDIFIDLRDLMIDQIPLQKSSMT